MSQFEQLAKTEARRTLVSEVWHLLSETKKWWLLPIVMLFVLFGVLMALSGTAAAPFIYTLF